MCQGGGCRTRRFQFHGCWESETKVRARSRRPIRGLEDLSLVEEHNLAPFGYLNGSACTPRHLTYVCVQGTLTERGSVVAYSIEASEGPQLACVDRRGQMQKTKGCPSALVLLVLISFDRLRLSGTTSRIQGVFPCARDRGGLPRNQNGREDRGRQARRSKACCALVCEAHPVWAGSRLVRSYDHAKSPHGGGDFKLSMH